MDALGDVESGEVRPGIRLVSIGANGSGGDFLQFIQTALGVGSLAIGFRPCLRP